jgi:hypothetical protein
LSVIGLIGRARRHGLRARTHDPTLAFGHRHRRLGRGRFRLVADRGLRGLGNGRLGCRGGFGRGYRLRFGLRYDLDPQTPRVGQAAHAIGRWLVDARRVALHTDLELVGELYDDSIVDAQLSGQLVDPDLLGGQNAVRFLASSVT